METTRNEIEKKLNQIDEEIYNFRFKWLFNIGVFLLIIGVCLFVVSLFLKNDTILSISLILFIIGCIASPLLANKPINRKYNLATRQDFVRKKRIKNLNTIDSLIEKSRNAEIKKVELAELNEILKIEIIRTLNAQMHVVTAESEKIT